MTDRVIDISEAPARLSVQHAQLVAEHGETAVKTPLAEVAALIVSNPGVQYTQAVLAGLMEAGGVLVMCDGHHLPSGMMLPLAGHHLQTERLSDQISASEPSRKRIWQQLVQAKIEGQSRLLAKATGHDCGLGAMAARVRSGDPDNLEAQAAHTYFPALFGAGFRRNREAPDRNALLNYGYTVLRALVARALVAAGLHPSIGVRHHNRYDPYCLAADVMEPFRVLVDEAVLACPLAGDETLELSPAIKRHLIGALLRRYEIDEEERTLFDIAARTSVSLVKAFRDGKGRLTLPTRW